MKELPYKNSVRSLPEYLPTEYQGVTQDFTDETTGEVELREYWRVVMKYRTLIAACIAVSALLSVLYAFTATPRYTAESTIRISTYEPVLGATKVEDILEGKSKEANYLETQIQEIHSYSLADKVLQNPEILSVFMKPAEPGFFRRIFGLGPSVADIEREDAVDPLAGYKTPVRAIKSYLELVQVKPIRRTSLVALAVTHQDPAFAALMVNKHALSYMDWVRENRMEQQSRGLKFLVTQADELREKVVDLERELADYAEENSIVALNKDENITVQKMSQLNSLFTEATAKRIEYEDTYRQAETALASNSAGFDDASTQSTRLELAKLEAEYQQMGAKFTDSYPKMHQLKSQINNLRESIAAQRGQIVAGLKSKYLAALGEEKKLKEELDQQKSQTFELSKRQVQYNVLNRELTSSRELLQNILRQIKETSLAVENNSSNVSVVDFATVPRNPTFPRKRLMLFLGVLFGLGAGLALVFLLNYLDNTIRTPEDVSSVLNLPTLGVVPSFEGEREGREQRRLLSLASQVKTEVTPDQSSIRVNPEASPAILDSQLMAAPGEDGSEFPVVFVADPKSLAAEAYRTIRTGILLSQAGEPPRTILVSSAQSSEGKTTSSINLAASLASSGGRVVLIDADLRRPSMGRHFKLDSGLPGLVEVLTGLAAFEDVAIKEVVKRMTIIPSGRIPPNPAELLGSPEMAAFLDKLASNFDYVIIDSPPILPVTDSVILSRYVDGVVLVVKGAGTPKKVVRDARERLRGVGARFLGVILNDVDVTSGDYYYYNRYYYSYYREDGKTSSSSKRAAGT